MWSSLEILSYPGVRQMCGSTHEGWRMGRGKGGGEEGREREKVRGEDVVWRGRRGQRGAGDVRERWKKKYRGIEREKKRKRHDLNIGTERDRRETRKDEKGAGKMTLRVYISQPRCDTFPPANIHEMEALRLGGVAQKRPRSTARSADALEAFLPLQDRGLPLACIGRLCQRLRPSGCPSEPTAIQSCHMPRRRPASDAREGLPLG